MGQLERFVETEICPLQHDNYVKNGKWESHTIYCMCSCSYCMQERLKKDYPDTGETGETYDTERKAAGK